MIVHSRKKAGLVSKEGKHIGEEIMNIVQINSGVEGSTGTIMMELGRIMREFGEKTMTSSRFDYSRRNTKYLNHIFIGNLLDKHVHRALAYASGKEGAFSKKATKHFLKEVSGFQPDVIHLHNLHANYINTELLFDYLKANDDVKVIWTLHDCWPFTGHCPYFDISKCEKWKKQCEKCSGYKSYPKTLFDNSFYMYNKKKAMFSGVKNLTIVTPSKWLSKQVKESFLADYPLRIINNGININVFKKYTNSDEVRKKYNMEKKYIILGVASSWGERKGLGAMNYLAECLPRNMQIVLVGISNDINVNKKIIGISKTENAVQLAQIYSAADLFVNPTLEDNYPTVNMEAIACGVPVITYKAGGSAEILDGKCGVAVEREDLEGLKEAIYSSLDKQWDKEEFERLRNHYSSERMVEEYLSLYHCAT